jgi:hypothetical protein
VAGVVDRAAEVADGQHLVVGEHEVVGRQHRRVGAGDPDLDPRVAHGLDGPDVVPVAVGGEHPAHAGGPRDVEQELVLVGGVDDHRFTGARAADDEHVVLERADDELVDARWRSRARGVTILALEPGHLGRPRWIRRRFRQPGCGNGSCLEAERGPPDRLARAT